MQKLDPQRTTWHITFGTYGTRLHGAEVPTVDRQHNQFGTPFLQVDQRRQHYARERMQFPPSVFSLELRRFIEEHLPIICERGGWVYRIAAAQDNHVHLLCDITCEVHGEKVRRLVKRWLGQSLSEQWPLPEGARWWAVEGSNKAIHDVAYLNNAFQYILRQRATSEEERS